MARNFEKLMMTCLVCEKKFNSKCFDLSTSTVKLLSAVGNMTFLCHRCIERVNRLKVNTRKSNEPASLAPHDRTKANMEHDEKSAMSDIMALLKKMDENLSRLNNSSNDTRHSTPACNQSDVQDSNHVVSQLAAVKV